MIVSRETGSFAVSDPLEAGRGTMTTGNGSAISGSEAISPNSPIRWRPSVHQKSVARQWRDLCNQTTGFGGGSATSRRTPDGSRSIHGPSTRSRVQIDKNLASTRWTRHRRAGHGRTKDEYSGETPTPQTDAVNRKKAGCSVRPSLDCPDRWSVPIHRTLTGGHQNPFSVGGHPDGGLAQR